MPKTFKLEIVTPDEKAIEKDIEEVTIPTSVGEISVLANHENLITQLVPGELRIKEGNMWSNLAVGEGFIKITGGAVSVITDLAAVANDIMEAEVEKAKREAEEAMKSRTLSDEEYAVAAATLQKALAQLRVKRRHHQR